MLPSLSLPPLECCLVTSPIQAEKLRPDRKAFGSATLATRVVAKDTQTVVSALIKQAKTLPVCTENFIRID